MTPGTNRGRHPESNNARETTTGMWQVFGHFVPFSQMRPCTSSNPVPGEVQSSDALPSVWTDCSRGRTKTAANRLPVGACDKFPPLKDVRNKRKGIFFCQNLHFKATKLMITSATMNKATSSKQTRVNYGQSYGLRLLTGTNVAF